MNANNTYLEALETQRQSRAVRSDIMSILYTIASVPLIYGIVHMAFSVSAP